MPPEHECHKENQWKDFAEFKVETVVYRKSLCKKLNSIQSAVWGLFLVVLVPFIVGLVSAGELKNETKRNSQDIREIRIEIKELQLQR